MRIVGLVLLLWRILDEKKKCTPPELFLDHCFEGR
jgi:hypothetical protein